MHSFLSFTVLINSKKVGWFGKISNNSKQHFSLTEDTFIGEFNLNLIQEQLSKDVVYRRISQYPFIKFDLSFEVTEETIANDILIYINNKLEEFEDESYIFDEYIEPNSNKRTIGFRIKARSYTSTIDEVELNKIRSTIISEITTKFSANLKDNE